jgi:hypothetical protein
VANEFTEFNRQTNLLYVRSSDGNLAFWIFCMAKEVFWFSFVHVQKLKNEKEKVKEESRPPASRACGPGLAGCGGLGPMARGAAQAHGAKQASAEKRPGRRKSGWIFPYKRKFRGESLCDGHEPENLAAGEQIHVGFW